MSDDIIVDDVAVPVFSDDELLKQVLKATEESDSIPVGDLNVEPPPRQRRGRPPGSKNKPRLALPIAEDTTSILREKFAKDASLRAQQILRGATGIPAIWLDRDHVQVTETEAQAICDPLASWAARNAELSPYVREFVEEWDLAAFFVGLSAYGVRVAKDERTLRRQQRAYFEAVRAATAGQQPFDTAVSELESAHRQSSRGDRSKSRRTSQEHATVAQGNAVSEPPNVGQTSYPIKPTPVIGEL